MLERSRRNRPFHCRSRCRRCRSWARTHRWSRAPRPSFRPGIWCPARRRVWARGWPPSPRRRSFAGSLRPTHTSRPTPARQIPRRGQPAIRRSKFGCAFLVLVHDACRSFAGPLGYPFERVFAAQAGPTGSAGSNPSATNQRGTQYFEGGARSARRRRSDCDARRAVKEWVEPCAISSASFCCSGSRSPFHRSRPVPRPPPSFAASRGVPIAAITGRATASADAANRRTTARTSFEPGGAARAATWSSRGTCPGAPSCRKSGS
jgi:hypothetical protein